MRTSIKRIMTQNVSMALKAMQFVSKTTNVIKMAKSERRRYNRQPQAYCNDFCDKKMRMTKTIRKCRRM